MFVAADGGDGVWAVNANECLMTRMQEMSLDYHFKVEQEVGSSTHAFFGFNGKTWSQFILSFFFSLVGHYVYPFLSSMILPLLL